MLDDIQPGLIRVICYVCGKPFWATRSDAKFCKPAHRQAYSRWRKRIPHRRIAAIKVLEDLGTYLEYPLSRDLALAELVLVRHEITRICREKGITLKEIR